MSIVFNKIKWIICSTALLCAFGFAAAPSLSSSSEAKEGDLYAHPQSWQQESKWMLALMLSHFIALHGDAHQAMLQLLKVARESGSYDSFMYGFNYSMEQEDINMAKHFSDAWLQAFPDDASAKEAHLVVLLQKGRTQESVNVLQARLSSQGKTLEEVSRINHLLDYMPTANMRAQVLGELSSLFKDNAYLLYFYGRRLLEMGDLLHAIDVFNQTIHIDPQWINVYMVQAQTLSAIGRLDQARRLLSAAMKDYPNELDLFYAYVDLLIRNYEYAEARTLIEKHLQRYPRHERLQRLLAWVYWHEGNTDAVQKIYRLLVKRNTMSESSYAVAMGRVWASQKDYQKARAVLLTVGQRNPEYGEAQQQLAGLLIKEGKIEEGMQMFDRIRDDVSSTRVLDHFFYEAAVLNDLKRYDLVVSLMDKALQYFPDDNGLQYIQGMALMQKGEYKRANDLFVRMLTRDMQNADILNACGYIQMEYMHNYSLAERYIEKALALYPESPNIQDSYGWLLYKQGYAEEALKWLLRAYAAYREGDISVHYVEVLASVGEEQRAREIYYLERKGQPDNEKLYKLGKRLGYEK